MINTLRILSGNHDIYQKMDLAGVVIFFAGSTTNVANFVNGIVTNFLNGIRVAARFNRPIRLEFFSDTQSIK
jgi:hypothetical protein